MFNPFICVEDALEISYDSKLSGFRKITNIKGRSDDWFEYGSIQVHPMVFRNILGQDANIKEYQVEQTKNGAIIRIVSDGNFDINGIKVQLTRHLKELGINAPSISIDRLHHLGRHDETGKVKRFIPLRNPKN